MKSTPTLHRRLGKAIVYLTGIGCLLLIYMIFIEPNRLVISRYVIQDERWQQKPLKIVMLSDIHTGSPFMTLERLETIVQRINYEEADIILLGGDYVIVGVIGGTHVDFEETVAKLSKLKSKLGTYAVLGNHDWWENGNRATLAFKNFKIPVLENSSRKITRRDSHFWLAGIADDSSRKPDINLAYQKIAADETVIQFSHDPYVFKQTPKRTILSLAGHTHGGQVNLLPLLPNQTAGRTPPRWSYGFIEEDGKKMVVTSGLGTSILPIRFNRPPEIAVVIITGQKD